VAGPGCGGAGLWTEHLAFGWPLPSILLGVVPGALLFGVAAVASRGLGVPIGLHAAWNLADWAVGRKDTPGLWTMVVDEPLRGRMATAGAFGYLAVMAAGVAGFWAWHRRRARDA
jgi:membrane protease YdiL (CAAX protease family)